MPNAGEKLTEKEYKLLVQSEFCIKRDLHWNIMFQVMWKKYFRDKIKTMVPVILKPLEASTNTVGAYLVDPIYGANAIYLANNSDLCLKEFLGVLLHEMCHHSVFQNTEENCHDLNYDEHGEEWQAEMKRVGFKDYRKPNGSEDHFMYADKYYEVSELLDLWKIELADYYTELYEDEWEFDGTGYVQNNCILSELKL